MNWPEVPCIDIGPLRADFNSEEAIQVGAKFAQAAQDVGFVSIRNHGVKRELIDEIEQVAKRFMALPLETKLGFSWDHQEDVDTGYFPAKLDGKEGFDIKQLGIYWDSDEPITKTKLPENAVCEGFKHAMNTYTKELIKLTKLLLHTLSRACRYADDKVNAFDALMHMHTSAMRLNYYPKRATAHTKGSDGEFLNCPEHFDTGLITILSQDDVGGLQVLRPSDQKWIDIPPQSDTLVINTGRAMEILSNGRSLATLHRVKFTVNRERVSIPFFVAPENTATIHPLNVPESEWKYGKIEYRQWIEDVIRATFPEYADRKRTKSKNLTQ